MGKLDPIVSEFETEEDEAAYDAWFRAEVEAALAEEGEDIPHEQVMAEIERLLDKYRDAQPRLEA